MKRASQLTLLPAMVSGEPLDCAEQDPWELWQGMPEYVHDDISSRFQVIVHMNSEEDLAAFEKAVGQRVPRNTLSIWFPKQERAVMRGTRYVSRNAEP